MLRVHDYVVARPLHISAQMPTRLHLNGGDLLVNLRPDPPRPPASLRPRRNSQGASQKHVPVPTSGIRPWAECVHRQTSRQSTTRAMDAGTGHNASGRCKCTSNKTSNREFHTVRRERSSRLKEFAAAAKAGGDCSTGDRAADDDRRRPGLRPERHRPRNRGAGRPVRCEPGQTRRSRRR